MNRRKFLTALGVIFPTFLLWGCGNDSKNKETSDNDDTDEGDVEVAACTTGAGITYTNPGHAHTVMPLTQMELDDAVPGDYNLMGGGHPHMVNLTAQDFANINSGMTVSKTSDTHGHTIDIVCS